MLAHGRRDFGPAGKIGDLHGVVVNLTQQGVWLQLGRVPIERGADRGDHAPRLSALGRGQHIAEPDFDRAGLGVALGKIELAVMRAREGEVFKLPVPGQRGVLAVGGEAELQLVAHAQVAHRHIGGQSAIELEHLQLRFLAQGGELAAGQQVDQLTVTDDPRDMDRHPAARRLPLHGQVGGKLQGCGRIEPDHGVLVLMYPGIVGADLRIEQPQIDPAFGQRRGGGDRGDPAGRGSDGNLRQRGLIVGWSCGRGWWNHLAGDDRG